MRHGYQNAKVHLPSPKPLSLDLSKAGEDEVNRGYRRGFVDGFSFGFFGGFLPGMLAGAVVLSSMAAYKKYLEYRGSSSPV